MIKRLKDFLIKKRKDSIKKVKEAPKKTAAKAKKAVKSKISKVKNSVMSGIFGAGTLGLIEGFFSAGDEATANAAANAEAASASAQRQAEKPTPTDDPTIDLQSVGTAIAQAMPSIPAMQDMLPTAGDYEIANLTVLDTIQLDTSVITEEGDQELSIPADTQFRAAIPQIGALFAMMAALKVDVLGLQGQLDTTNMRLEEIREAVDEAMRRNGATRRANERRRDEEKTEEKPTTRVGVLMERGKQAAKDAAKGFLAVLGGMVTSAVMIGVGSAMADTGDALMEEDEIPEEEISSDAGVEEQFLNELSTEDDSIQGTLNKTTGIASNIGLGAAVTAAGAGLAATAGIAGAAGVAAVAAPIAVGAAAVTAVAGAAALGTAIGTTLYDQFIEDPLSEALSKHFAGDDIDLGTMDSPEAIKEKYSGMDDVEVLGDLLGEGMFDLAEKPTEIAGWFRDNVPDLSTYSELDKEYQEEYGDSLSVAIGRVVGTKGLDSIMQVITNNMLAAREDDSADSAPQPITEKIAPVKEINGFRVRPISAPMFTRRDSLMPSSQTESQQNDSSTTIIKEDGSIETVSLSDPTTAQSDTVTVLTEKDSVNPIDYDPAFNSINSSEEKVSSESIFTLPDFTSVGKSFSSFVNEGVSYVQEHVKNYNIDKSYADSVKNAMPSLELMAKGGDDFLSVDSSIKERAEVMMPVVEMIGAGFEKVNNDMTNMMKDVLPDLDHNIKVFTEALETPMGEMYKIVDATGEVAEGVMTEQAANRMKAILNEAVGNRDYIADLVQKGRDNAEEYVVLREDVRNETSAMVAESEEPSAIKEFFANVYGGLKEAGSEALARTMRQFEDVPDEEELDEIRWEEKIATEIKSTLPELKGTMNDDAVQQIIPMIVPMNVQRAQQQSHSPAGNTSKSVMGNALPAFRASDSFLLSEPQS